MEVELFGENALKAELKHNCLTSQVVLRHVAYGWLSNHLPKKSEQSTGSWAEPDQELLE